MIVIFEGPDGAGKSTMVEEVKQFHLEQGHHPTSVSLWRAGPFPADSDAWREYVLPLTSLTPSKDWLVLIDRWHIGELVYGPVLRGQSRLSLEQRQWIDGYLRSLGAVMIHLTATEEELNRRLGHRGDDLIKDEHIPELLTAYAEHLYDSPQSILTTRVYGTTGQQIRPIATAIYMLAKLNTSIAIGAQYHPSTDQRPYWEQHAWPS